MAKTKMPEWLEKATSRKAEAIRNLLNAGYTERKPDDLREMTTSRVERLFLVFTGQVEPGERGRKSNPVRKLLKKLKEGRRKRESLARRYKKAHDAHHGLQHLLAETLLGHAEGDEPDLTTVTTADLENVRKALADEITHGDTEVAPCVYAVKSVLEKRLKALGKDAAKREAAPTNNAPKPAAKKDAAKAKAAAEKEKEKAAKAAEKAKAEKAKKSRVTPDVKEMKKPAVLKELEKRGVELTRTIKRTKLDDLRPMLVKARKDSMDW